MNTRQKSLALLAVPLVATLAAQALHVLFNETHAHRESESRSKLLWERTLDMMLWLDENDCIVEANAAAGQGFGYAPAHMLGLDLRSLCAAAELDKFAEALDYARKHGHSAIVSSQQRRSGELFPSEVAISSIDLGGKRSVLMVLRDMTERTRADASLAIAYAQAVESSRLKSQFVATMSHEIRTPMNAVIGMNELLLGTPLSEEQREYTETVKESSLSLLGIIDDVLDFSKIEAGGLELETIEMNLPDTVESAVALLAPSAQRKGISLMTYIDPQVPRLVLGDQIRVRQILLNLIGNAIKFTTKGGVVVTVTCRSEDRRASFVRFTVKDSGIGFDAVTADAIFEPFRQADGSTTRKFGGTGLGLSISRRLVEKMGGLLSVESTPDFGSEFSFTISLTRSTDETLIPIASVSGLRVLVVDDDRSALEILYRYMIDWGISATVASSATEALELMRERAAANQPFDVAIIDYAMPGITGIELAERIKADPMLKDVHLVMVTAYDGARRGEAAIAAGFSSYLPKPVRHAQLFDCVANAIRESDAAAIEPVYERLRAMPRLEHGDAARPERILLVEDQPVNQRLVVQQLKRLGFATHAVANGMLAVDALAFEMYDLVFMDCQMPVMDGFAATRSIRKMELHTGRRVPIIAMTANAQREDREECLVAGMDDYLAKPVMIEQIRTKLKTWLPTP